MYNNKPFHGIPHSMLLYNVTVKIDNSRKENWLKWMLEVHIPDVMKTDMFTEFKISRLLEQDDRFGTTYAIQYLCKNRTTYEEYQEKFAPELQKEHTEKFKNHFVAFRTLLEVIDQS